MVGDMHLDPKHLLWTLYFLKSLEPFHGLIARQLHVDYKTLKKHVYPMLRTLNAVLPEVCLNFIIIVICLSNFHIVIALQALFLFMRLR